MSRCTTRCVVADSGHTPQTKKGRTSRGLFHGRSKIRSSNCRRPSSPCRSSSMLPDDACCRSPAFRRSEEHTSELQSLMRISYAVFCLKKKINNQLTVPEHH